MPPRGMQLIWLSHLIHEQGASTWLPKLVVRFAGHPLWPELKAGSLFAAGDPANAARYMAGREYQVMEETRSLESLLFEFSLRDWLKQDQADALAWATAPQPTRVRVRILDTLGVQPEMNPLSPEIAQEAALRVLQPLEGEELAKSLESYVRAFFWSAPASVARLLRESPSTDINKWWLDRALESWGYRDPAEAVTFLRENDLGAEQYGRVADGWTRKDAKLARTWIDTLKGENQEAAEKAWLTQRFVQEPDLLITVSKDLPPEWLPEVGSDVVKRLVRATPSGTETWLDTLPAGESRDRLVLSAAEGLAPLQPTEALRLMTRFGVTPDESTAATIAGALRYAAPDAIRPMLEAMPADSPARAAATAALLSPTNDCSALRSQARSYLPLAETDRALFYFVESQDESDETMPDSVATLAADVLADVAVDDVTAKRRFATAQRVVRWLGDRWSNEQILVWAARIRDPQIAGGARAALEKRLPHPTPAQRALLDRLPQIAEPAAEQ